MANDDDIIGPVPSIYVDHRIEIGESIVISGVITPLGNYSGVIPLRIKINDGSTDSYISLNTDSQGYYSTEYTFQTIGVHTITAMVGSEVSNSKTIYCYSNDTLTLSSDKNIIMAGEMATITATLEENGVPVSGETVLFSAQKQGKTFTASNFSDIKNISTITNANNKVHIESFDTREIGLIVYDDVFGTYDHITRFTIENFETEDVGYICAVRNNTPVNSFIELSNGDYELITYYQHDIISVYKDGDFVGEINLGSAGSTYQIGFYLSDTRMNLVDFNDAEYLGSNVTDSSGKATVSYLGRGAGDIYIKADCMFLSETYVVEDCLEYQEMTSNAKQSRWTIPSAVSSSSIFGYSSDGWKFGNASSYSSMPLDRVLEYPFSVEFTVRDKYGIAPIILFQNSNGNYIGMSYGNGGNLFGYSNNGGGMSTSNVNYNLINGSVIKVELTADSFKTYVNDVLIDERSHSLNPTNLKFNFQTGGNRWNVLKDFKLKPL